jgi:hypothetical protein
MRTVTDKILAGASGPTASHAWPAMLRRPGRSGNRMPPRTTGVAWGASVASGVRRQVRKLRKALRRGNALDALAAAARIHAAAVQPNMRAGGWPQAQACCEAVLSHIPARQAPGYLPGLRGVLECLHADAARAARAGGDLRGAEAHLHALLGYLREGRAPLARQVTALVDLAYIHIDLDDARAGRRILAGLGPFLASVGGTGGDFEARPDLWSPWPRFSVPAQRKPAD